MDELTATDHLSLSPLARLGIALSDPIRQTIMLRLADGPAFPSELAEIAGTSRSNLSNHLSCLRECGLVVGEREGRNIRYELVTDRLGSALLEAAQAVEEMAIDEVSLAGARGR